MATANLLERLTVPKRVTLPVVRGDSVYFLIKLKDQEAGGSAVPLDGKVGKASIRKAIDAPVETMLAVTVDQTTTGATVGHILIQATGEQTTLFPEFGVWDLQLSDGSPTGVFRKTLVQGPLKFVRDVTSA